MRRVNEVAWLSYVRIVPRSRHDPEFKRDVLAASLSAVQISYIHLPGLGGLRHARAVSPNSGCHNLSFRGYPDYMQALVFAEYVLRVAEMSKAERCFLMSAEASPWRFPRSMPG